MYEFEFVDSKEYERMYDLFLEYESKVEKFESSLDADDKKYLSLMFVERIITTIFSKYTKVFLVHDICADKRGSSRLAVEAIKEVLRAKGLEYSSIINKYDHIIVNLKNPYWR